MGRGRGLFEREDGRRADGQGATPVLSVTVRSVGCGSESTESNLSVETCLVTFGLLLVNTGRQELARAAGEE